ncbi:MAG: glycosyltransferase family 2 protein [Pseudohongiella sp.]|nr:glycosyltransferase family 2 protein [Pseudohongiella sp.]
MEEPVMLSICIATFQRRESLARLLNELLVTNHDVEICIVVDGSTDGTVAYLSALEDSRIKVVYQANAGRASALKKAIDIASGSYIVIFDDDDILSAEGLDIVLTDIKKHADTAGAGFIYSLENGDENMVLGDEFPVSVSNFLELRADFKLKGDKKEVIRASVLKAAVASYELADRRIPTSLFWSIIALHHNVVCRNVIIGKKYYLSGGLTNNIKSIKFSNPKPMIRLNAVKIKGFFMRRYKSLLYFVKACLSWLFYSCVYGLQRVRNHRKS